MELAEVQFAKLRPIGTFVMWYLATLIMQCQVGDQTQGPWTLEEQIRLLEAPDCDTAYAKALEIAVAEAHSYQNQAGQMVSWTFIGFEDLEELSDAGLQDGMEIRCRFLQNHEPATLISPKAELSVYLSKPAL